MAGDSARRPTAQFRDGFGGLSRRSIIQQRLSAEAKQTRRSKVLVFVHGFNNRFDEAVYRLAQIAHDSNAPAIPVLFSWPSRGDVRLVAYTSDRESASSSSGALEKLLDTISQNPNVKEITDVVQCHNDHHGAAQGVDGSET